MCFKSISTLLALFALVAQVVAQSTTGTQTECSTTELLPSVRQPVNFLMPIANGIDRARELAESPERYSVHL
jgi:hypothetical protein